MRTQNVLFDFAFDILILKYEIEFVIKAMNLELRIKQKTRLKNYCQNIRLDIGSSNKHRAHQNLFIYYTWKNIR